MDYGEKTWEVFSLLNRENIRFRYDKSRRIQIVSNEKDVETIQAANEHIRMIIFSAKLPEEKKQEFALRLGVSSQSLSMYVSPAGNFRYPPRNIVLRAIMLHDDFLNREDANHILMELKHPGLFVNTWNLYENQRNYLIDRVIQFAFERRARYPRREWSLFLDETLARYGMETLFDGADGRLTKEESDILRDWEPGFRDIRATDYSVFRREMRDRIPGDIAEQYLQIRRNLALLYHTQEERIEQESVQRFFASSTNKNSRVGRARIIEMGIAMRCAIDEVNRMLQEANHAHLYPRQADMSELEAIRLLAETGGQFNKISL